MQPSGLLMIVQVWEQEVAWTEADKPIKLAARALTVPNDHKLNREPIFCFETMMHMLYWSCLVYDYKRVGFAALYKTSNDLCCCYATLQQSERMAKPCNTLLAGSYAQHKAASGQYRHGLIIDD